MFKVASNKTEKSTIFGLMEKYDERGLNRLSDSLSHLLSGKVSIDDLDTLQFSFELMDTEDVDVLKPILEVKVAELVNLYC